MSTEYHVQSGDTLTAIAAHFGVTVASVLAANPNITNPNMIALGQLIAIPTDVQSPTSQPAPPPAAGVHAADGSPHWVDRIFDFLVEKHEIPRLGNTPYRAMARTGIGVLHTTEGSHVSDAIHEMEHGLAAGKPSDPCHFIAGENRIVQCRPIGFQAASLRGAENQFAYIQIEMVAFSKTESWMPPDSTLKPALAIVAYCFKNLGIPLAIPNDWPDSIADVKPFPSSNNTRRQLKIWPNQQGWYLHMEVCNQQPSNHWDCGAMRRTELLRMARTLAEA